VKLKVDGHDAMRARLRAMNAEPAGIVRETNIFFDRADSSLRRADTGLRVRFTTTADRSTPTALLTVKGPRQDTGLRAREAFDLTLTPHDQIVPLLNVLGFEQILLFEKDRESWRLEGCLVELDNLPHFGTFVEIEGPSEEAVTSVQRLLHLDQVPAVHPGYSQMIAEHLRCHQPASNELRF
jgi:adenylate cyclase class 2